MKTLLKQAFAAAGFLLSDEQAAQFEKYYHILLDWNQRMNLTAIEDKEDVVYKHFLDSVLTSKVSGPLAGRRLIDIGTGAGFPGVPLKIMEPSLNVCLFDSLQKRIHFLEHLCSALSLNAITVLHGRAEDYGQQSTYREQFDIATARAVAKLPILAELCLPFVKPGGCFIALKGPEVQQELAESKQALTTLGGQVRTVETIALTQGQYERNLIVIEKIRPTPKKYPRRAGIPQKTPLR